MVGRFINYHIPIVVSRQRFCDLCGKDFPTPQKLRNHDNIYTCIELEDKINNSVKVTETKFFIMHYGWKY